MREEAITIIDPMLNPDGRDRYVNWYKSARSSVLNEDAAEFATKDKSGLTSVKLLEEENKEEKKAADEVDPEAFTTYAAREDTSGLKRIPGSAFKGHIDNTNPLAFGIPDRLYSLKFSNEALQPSTDWQLVGYYDRDPESVMAAGSASQKNREHAAGKGFAGVQEIGLGKVVFLLDNTQYRMFWVGPARMMQNAVMLLHDM
ncbi:hypothetical protein [Fodinibius sp. AD559]|uniref:hypothetical protein n=1 Tax=Fodinibius sp. AD559 TaxID=3424179 RepID=UPI004046F200